MRSPFLDVLSGREPECTPVWFMRQAGRYMASYRQLKGNRTVLDLAKDPDAASGLVADAVKRLGVDAGIIFADIMLPLGGLGVDFEIEENVGPVVSSPIRTAEQVDGLGELEPESDVPFVLDGIEKTVEKLGGETPLIGFAGAPFTLAGYLVEGRPSRDLATTRYMMHSDPDSWGLLMEKLSEMVIAYLRSQVKHGVHAVQLFDSWVGCLSTAEYEEHVLKYTKRVFEGLGGAVPRIHFCADSSRLLERFWETGPEAVSVDWRTPLADVWRRCADDAVAQGNLDPTVASVGGRELEEQVGMILAQARGKRHIFSLGHGVLQSTPEENLKKVVARVHEETRAN
jgi:uroporphyrinogen decarboxylase